MTSLDSLAMIGSELTAEQLDAVDGGEPVTLTLLAIGFVVFTGGVIFGAVSANLFGK